MSPEPSMTSQYDHKNTCDCEECADARFKARNRSSQPRKVTALWPVRTPLNTLICSVVIILIGAAIGWLWPGMAQGRTTHSPKPIEIPQSHAQARAECPLNKPLVCRAALIHALEAVSWQRAENLKLARQMLGKLGDWTCIHQGEGAWNAHTGNGYYGGLQMDATFERTYGRDMLARYHAHADAWPPKAQIIVAQRAFIQGRGYAPWPNTSHACGLR